ncbi:MAG: NAD(P)-dependent oxidoreductase [Bacteroidales bacterium]|nr:NAD(P)-dependent oxidoreductase [Bacteroidales bacterium]
MRTIVTGGAGFIGSAVIPVLKNAGHEIFVIDNLSFGNRDFIHIPDDHFFPADIRDESLIHKLMHEIHPEVIIHLAAVHFIPYCNAHPFEAAEINIRGTMNILKSAKHNKDLKKLFFASTAAVYPISDIAVKETHQLLPLDIYGLSKLTGEELCSKFFLETGIDTIVCRFFNAFGPNETNPHLIPEIEKQLREGKRTIQLGNLTPKRDFIHTYDMAEAVRMLIDLKHSGFEIYNLGRNIEYSVTEIVEAFEKQLNEKIHIEVAPERIRKVERMHLLADISKLKNKTGWEPKWSIDDGIRDLVKSWGK